MNPLLAIAIVFVIAGAAYYFGLFDDVLPSYSSSATVNVVDNNAKVVPESTLGSVTGVPTDRSVVVSAPPASYPTKWQCISEVNVPLRRENNANHDISCMSINGRNCIAPGESCSESLAYYNTGNNSASLQPLTCGAMHLKEWGITGYDTTGHWCGIADKIVPRP